jgi:HSP20 family protein
MSITRWDPWGEMVSLRDAMDRLVSESFIRPAGEGGRASSPSTLAVDVREEGDNYIITAPMPGVSPDNVEITVLGDTVRIRGERREERQEGGDNQRWLMREQRYGFFERAVRLPAPLKADAAQAEFRDGILMLSLPKSEEAKERRIPIQGGQRAGQGQDVQISASSGATAGTAAGQQAQQTQQSQQSS